MAYKLPPDQHAVIIGREGPKHEWSFITFASKLEAAWHSAYHIQHQERLMGRPRYETGVLTQSDYDGGHTRRLIKAPEGFEYYSEPVALKPGEKVIVVEDRVSSVPLATPLAMPKNAVVGSFKSTPKAAKAPAVVEKEQPTEQPTEPRKQRKRRAVKETQEVTEQPVTEQPVKVVPVQAPVVPSATVLAAAEPDPLQANLAAFLNE